MIDLERERVLSMGQARAYLPRRRGKRPAATTVWRWIVKGHRGIHLDGLRTPAGWMTSVEAIQRFLIALGDLDRKRVNRGLPTEIELRRQRDPDWADKILDAGRGKKLK